MTTITKNITVFLILLAIIGCSDLTGESTGANKIKDSNTKTMGGIGYSEIFSEKVLLDGVMENGGDSSHNFEFKLKLEDNKSGVFFFYSDQELSQGIQLSFKKVKQKALITLTINGISHSIFHSLTGDDVLHFLVDIHNDHEDAHVLIWNVAGPFGDAEECVEENTCVYNTEFFTDPNPGPWGSHGKGPGQFWGFEGDKEIIIKLSKPKKPLSHA